MSTSNKAKPALVAIDLFCGCGGLTEGLKQAGFQVLGAVDINDLAVETYKKNHGDDVCKVWQRDIRKLAPAKVRRALKLRKGALSLLAGCPPCEGFSRLRTLNGSRVVHDDRNDLVFNFLQYAEEFLPKTIMMENVPALARDARIEQVQARLEDLGYIVRIKILDAADYAVPQRRRRMILLAGRGFGVGFAPKARKRVTVKDAIDKLPEAKSHPDKGDDPLHHHGERRSARILRKIRMLKEGQSLRDLPEREWLECTKRSDGFRDVYGRMKRNDVAPTITGGCTNPSKGRFLHPTENRAITLREAALLQTFPESYTFSLRRGKEGAAQLIGDALPPEFIRRHAMSVRRALEREADACTVQQTTHELLRLRVAATPSLL